MTSLRIVIPLYLVDGASSFPKTGVHFSDHALAGGRGAGLEPPQTLRRLLERRIDRKRLAEIRNRARRIGKPLADQAAGRECARRIGIELDRLIDIGQRQSVVPAEITRPGAIVEGERGAWRQVDRAAVIGDRVAERKPLPLGVAAVYIGVCGVRIEFDGLL